MKNDSRLTDKEFRDALTYIEEMRKLADFLEEHPILLKTDYGLPVFIYAYNKEDLAMYARELGTADKISSNYEFGFRKSFGPHSIKLTAPHDEVCEKVKVGTKVVKKRDEELVAAALATVPEIEVEEDLFEWKCPESILRD